MQPETARRTLSPSVTSPSASFAPQLAARDPALEPPDEHAHVAARARSACTIRDPTKPVPPVTKTLSALSSTKFFQYRLGVGPRCPWYFEPSPLDPYGADAGSVSCTNETCPIFIPG